MSWKAPSSSLLAMKRSTSTPNVTLAKLVSTRWDLQVFFHWHTNGESDEAQLALRRGTSNAPSVGQDELGQFHASTWGSTR